MKELWRTLDLYCFCQQRDPQYFLEVLATDTGKLHRRFWVLRLLLLGGIAVLLALAAITHGLPWVYCIALGILPGTLLALGIGGILPWSGEPRFWLLYLFSPPTLAMMLLSGLAPIAPLALVGGWVLAFPILAGMLALNAGTVWIYYQHTWDRISRVGKQPGGPRSQLPQLARWNRVRWGVLATATCLALLVGPFRFVPTTPEEEPLAQLVVIGLLVAIGTTLHLEGTLLSFLPSIPLVQYDAEQERWRGSYIGRTALLVSPAALRRTLLPDTSPSTASARLLALITDGPLAPQVRGIMARLPLASVHRLLLHTSFQEGGATAIAYLLPAAAPALRPLGAWYGALATEAARPFPQSWFNALKTLPEGNPPLPLPLATSLPSLLDQLTNAFLTLDVTIVERALADLARWCHEVEDPLLTSALLEYQTSASLHPSRLSWPLALFIHLDERRALLRHPALPATPTPP